ncbi:ImuA family protein [Pararhizobium haloflavum]|uniref:ImuA family protein n=1 Tax=Pararhizobium haloflavum TaxID=2037914 RepID=UPI0018E4367F|nr:hypothetical protein [Pararhizobium haloflavum]
MQDAVAQLKQKLATLEPAKPAPGSGFTLGCQAIDEALGGGLPRASLHEVFVREVGDAGAGAGFALALAIRASRIASPIVWIRNDLARMESGGPYGPGITEYGFDPDAIILVSAKNETMALRAALEAFRSKAPGVVLLELWGAGRRLDLTASRRMMLAAAKSGVTGLVFRPTGAPQPSAALSRWMVAASSSESLTAGAPSHPVFDISLERHRAGIAPGRWRVEWNRDRKSFDESRAIRKSSAGRIGNVGVVALGKAVPVPGAVVPFSVDRPAASTARPQRGRRVG